MDIADDPDIIYIEKEILFFIHKDNNSSNPKINRIIIAKGNKNHPKKVNNPATKMIISKAMPMTTNTVLTMTPIILDIRLEKNADR